MATRLTIKHTNGLTVTTTTSGCVVSLVARGVGSYSATFVQVMETGELRDDAQRWPVLWLNEETVEWLVMLKPVLVAFMIGVEEEKGGAEFIDRNLSAVQGIAEWTREVL